MKEATTRTRPTLWLALLLAMMLAGSGAAAYMIFFREPSVAPSRVAVSAPSADLAERVHSFCSACHAYPPPESFPRSEWKKEVKRGYHFFGHAGRSLQPPAMDDVIRYYEERAPTELPAARPALSDTPPGVRFAATHVAAPPGVTSPAVSNINLVHLFDDRRLEILATDMRSGQVLLLKPYEKEPRWQVLAKLAHPARAEVVDLDRDGIKDLIVADLGSFAPTDLRWGQVVWLRGQQDGTFAAVTLLKDVGRVADVQAADFRGAGKLDLVVASFGLHNIGEILLLENQTTDWSKPKFVPRILDDRHGTIHVPVTDLNGDGKPDFVALISQEHETVVAFLNDGGGQFRKQVLFDGPHPGYGSSGIQLVDLDGDGDRDVLYTNGDILDPPYMLKPYHGVQWLENPGRPGAAWKHHSITQFYGAHGAVAADFRGNGKKDLVAVSFLPAGAFPQREPLGLESVLFLEQLAVHRYAAHALEKTTCDHVTCAAGDLYATGRADFVTGHFSAVGSSNAITIWKNLGPQESE